jgi:hypothetical protein
VEVPDRVDRELDIAAPQGARGVGGTQQVAQTTLRSVLGQTTLDDLLTKRDEVNTSLQQIIDGVTDPWGVKVTLVEVKDVILPESMRRAMASQAEAERDRRAKVIHAIGEKEAAANLGEAAEIMERHPAALQLRTLGTLLELGEERNSTIAFPVPMELVRLLEKAAGHGDSTRRGSWLTRLLRPSGVLLSTLLVSLPAPRAAKACSARSTAGSECRLA